MVLLAVTLVVPAGTPESVTVPSAAVVPVLVTPSLLALTLAPDTGLVPVVTVTVTLPTPVLPPPSPSDPPPPPPQADTTKPSPAIAHTRIATRA